MIKTLVEGVTEALYETEPCGPGTGFMFKDDCREIAKVVVPIVLEQALGLKYNITDKIKWRGSKEDFVTDVLHALKE